MSESGAYEGSWLWELAEKAIEDEQGRLNAGIVEARERLGDIQRKGQASLYETKTLAKKAVDDGNAKMDHIQASATSFFEEVP